MKRIKKYFFDISNAKFNPVTIFENQSPRKIVKVGVAE